MQVVHALTLACGEYRCPESLVVALRTMPMRTVNRSDGEINYRVDVPDWTSADGAKYYAWLKEQQRLELVAYEKGDAFIPGEFI